MRIDFYARERDDAFVDETTNVKIWKADDQRATYPYQLMMFRPRATKPFAQGSFPTNARRAAYIESELENARSNLEYKEARKLERKEARKNGWNGEGIKPLDVIAPEVRSILKTEFPKCKFSVRTEYYSMGSALHVKLLKADFPVFRTAEEIENDFRLDAREKENLIYNITNGHSQVSAGQHLLDTHRDRDITPLAIEMLNKVIRICNQDNWDHSDIQTDYYDVHYHFELQIGSSEKSLEVVE